MSKSMFQKKHVSGSKKKVSPSSFTNREIRFNVNLMCGGDVSGTRTILKLIEPNDFYTLDPLSVYFFNQCQSTQLLEARHVHPHGPYVKFNPWKGVGTGFDGESTFMA